LAESLGTDVKTLGDIWVAIAGTLTLGVATGIYSYVQYLFQKKKAKDNPTDWEIVDGSIADMRPVRQLVKELGPRLEKVYAHLELIISDRAERKESIQELAEDHKSLSRDIAEVLTILRRMEKQGEIERAVAEDREKQRLLDRSKGV